MTSFYRSYYAEVSPIKKYVPCREAGTKPLDGLPYLAQSARTIESVSEERFP